MGMRGANDLLTSPQNIYNRLLLSAFPLLISVRGPNYRERFKLQGLTVLIDKKIDSDISTSSISTS